MLDLMSYRVDNVKCRSHEAEYVDGEMELVIEDFREEPFGGNIVNEFYKNKFTSEMGDIDELYKEVKRSLTFRLEPKIVIDNNVIIVKKLAKENGVNPTQSEIFDWQVGDLHLRLIEYRFRVVKTIKSVDFDINGILDEDAPDTIMGFKVVDY